jgi:hypothetical protein
MCRGATVSQIEKLVARAVAACVSQEVLIARRDDRDQLEGLKHRVRQLEDDNIRNQERIRALERANEGHPPADLEQRLRALIARLQSIGAGRTRSAGRTP